MKLLENKIAIITGGTSGIGHATALAFAREGAKVVVAGRRQPEGQAVADEVIAAGGEAIFIQTDVAQEDQVERLFSQATERFGRVDVVFNNAGVEGRFGQPVHESTGDDYTHLFDINVKGAFFVQKHASRALSAAGGGSIVNTSSIAGHIGFPGAALYDATKHAVEGLTKTGALELAKANIRVNAVAPGAIDTAMSERALGEHIDHVASLHPMGRIGRAQEVAEAVVFLASDRASFITGQSLAVDGGFTAA